MKSTNHKLRLAGALAVLATLALAISCQGFFPRATLQSISLQPPTPSFGVGFQQPMQAWGTDSNSHRYQLTSGVSWTVSSPSSGTVATIDPSSGTLTGKNAGTITVQASAQGLSASATATVVETVSIMVISPGSGSVQDTGTAYQPFTVKDGSGNDISSLVTLTAEQSNAPVTGLPCGFELGLAGDGTQDCQPGQGLVTVQTDFDIVVTYSGYTGTAPVTAKLTVTPAP